MKKLVLFTMLVVLFVSCKEKLPSNMSSALYNYERQVEYNRESDSIILSLTKESIDKLSMDSINIILFKNAYASDRYNEVEKKLDEYLKYNPEYSDYNEIKNKVLPYRYTDLTKFYNNVRYLNEIEFYNHSIKYDKNTEKPQYGL
jgi:hypothetical protein